MNSLILSRTYSVRSFFLGKIALPCVLMYRDFFKSNKQSWNENKESLSRFSERSIGREMSVFLNSNNIELEERMENHDLFHVVLGYGTSLPEEAALHFFLIANRKKSLYPFIAAFVGFVFFPEYYELYLDAYHRGMISKSFSNLELREYLKVDVQTFRKIFSIPERNM